MEGARRAPLRSYSPRCATVSRCDAVRPRIELRQEGRTAWAACDNAAAASLGVSDAANMKSAGSRVGRRFEALAGVAHLRARARAQQTAAASFLYTGLLLRSFKPRVAAQAAVSHRIVRGAFYVGRHFAGVGEPRYASFVERQAAMSSGHVVLHVVRKLEARLI